MIRSKLTSVQRLEMTSSNIAPERLLDAVLEQDIDILRRTKETVNREDFYRAADALQRAQRVYILGSRQLSGPGYLPLPLFPPGL